MEKGKFDYDDVVKEVKEDTDTENLESDEEEKTTESDDNDNNEIIEEDSNSDYSD